MPIYTAIIRGDTLQPRLQNNAQKKKEKKIPFLFCAEKYQRRVISLRESRAVLYT